MSEFEIKELPLLNQSPFDTFVNWYNNERQVSTQNINDAQFTDMNLRGFNNAQGLQSDQLKQIEMLTAANMLVDGSYRDGSVMMEGPFDHSRVGSPSEYFMPTHIHPFKLGMVARFTALGWRICYEFSQDCWVGGLGVRLIGEEMVKLTREVNVKLKAIFRELNYTEKMELGTGFGREQGQSLFVLYYDGEKASKIGKDSKDIKGAIKSYAYMSKEAPKNKDVVKMEAFNRQYYFVSKDDGRGNPTEFKISIYLGKYHGRMQIPVHHSRCVWLRRTDVERDFEGHSVIEPCYSELIITTNILKACGEIAFRWGTGHPVILTKGLSPGQSEVFKRLLGNPIRKDWHVFPSEMVEAFDLISQKSGMVDLPALGDFVIGLVVASSTIPRPILMGEVSGVVTGGEVNERSYFALLDKEHSNLEPVNVELFQKIPQIRRLLEPYMFEFDWGIRQSMSEMEQIDIETKKIANIISKISTFLPLNQGLNELGYPPLESMVDPEYRDYARMLGNSVLSFTMFQLEEMRMGFQMEREQQQLQNFQGKTTSGNDSKGKGKGVSKSYNKGDDIKAPKNYQRSKAATMSSVKNKVGVVMSAFRNLPEFESIPKTAKVLGIAPNTFYKLEAWKDDN